MSKKKVPRKRQQNAGGFTFTVKVRPPAWFWTMLVRGASLINIWATIWMLTR